jgi:hypothetical protein
VGTRIFELEKMGYLIQHEQEPGARFITYFLVSEPEQPKPLPAYQAKGPDPSQFSFANSADWYERQTGRPRPTQSEPIQQLGSLFEVSR